jgi:hypothetical protein
MLTARRPRRNRVSGGTGDRFVVCFNPEAAERAGEVAAVLTAVATAGGSAVLVTLTMRHLRGVNEVFSLATSQH